MKSPALHPELIDELLTSLAAPLGDLHSTDPQHVSSVLQNHLGSKTVPDHVRLFVCQVRNR